jgi:hypothetical protein
MSKTPQNNQPKEFNQDRIGFSEVHRLALKERNPAVLCREIVCSRISEFRVINRLLTGSIAQAQANLRR